MCVKFSLKTEFLTNKSHYKCMLIYAAVYQRGSIWWPKCQYPVDLSQTVLKIEFDRCTIDIYKKKISTKNEEKSFKKSLNIRIKCQHH